MSAGWPETKSCPICGVSGMSVRGAQAHKEFFHAPVKRSVWPDLARYVVANPSPSLDLARKLHEAAP